ncbi:MAG: cytochrome c oxidase accessory protein CcoG [Thermoanaerobaculia bacterium]
MSGSEGYFSRHVKVHPRIVAGRFARLRIWALVATLGVMFGAPWLRWGSRPAIWLDLPHRKFHLFGLVLWPQDLIYLTALLALAALFLFLVTALAGRVWCGYACPQTVFTQIFVWIERLFEGDRARQLRLEKGGWSARRAFGFTAKLLFWSLFAFAVAVSVLGLFVPIRELLPAVVSGRSGAFVYGAIAFVTGAILLFAGRMREQVCVYMCPYARFQSAMFDRDTLIVSYDEKRGEPRGPLVRGELDARTAGSCIDCTLCVQVCPTGIDIRNGLQYQCIACASCIDACDEVMDRIGAPRGLVRYTTSESLDGRRPRIGRPRVGIYAALLVIGALALGVSVARRIPLEIDVLRDRTVSYREATGGRIENVYRLRILNMDQSAHRYRLAANGPEGIEVVVRESDLAIPAGEIRDVAVRVRIPSSNLTEHSTRIEFRLEALDAPRIVAHEPSRFLGPSARAGSNGSGADREPA